MKPRFFYHHGAERLKMYLVLSSIGALIAIIGSYLGNWKSILEFEKSWIAISGIGFGLMLIVILALITDSYIEGKEAD